MIIGKGTLRVTIEQEQNKVLKLPIGLLGEIANYNEYQNSLVNRHVARSQLYRAGLIMERLTNLKTYDLYLSNEDLVKSLVLDFGISEQESITIVKNRYRNRLQVGVNSHGEVKIFDAEGTKAGKPKTFYIGLVGSGKTTLYRKLNENKECSAVEIELPQSCLNDEFIKSKLFELFYYNNNIDCIISHPYYLPKDFWGRISSKDTIIYLDIPLDERLERIKKRSKELETNSNTLFSTEFIKQEEEYYIRFKDKVAI